MTITIHQPDMLPWLGLFNKISKADLWVILDHTINNPRDAAFWGRRVKMLLNGEGKWLSLPLKKPKIKGMIGIPINEMEFNTADSKIYKDALSLVELNYKKTPFFKDIFPIVENFLLSTEVSMSRRNLSFMFQIMNLLEIDTRVCYSSELDCQATSTALLVEIMQKMKGTVYLCGDGAGGYQQDELFHQVGIEVFYNNFKHPSYPQVNTKGFVPGLSIIDALMQVGISETKKLIRCQSAI